MNAKRVFLALLLSIAPNGLITISIDCTLLTYMLIMPVLHVGKLVIYLFQYLLIVRHA